jgi:formamidopyrimidine-DNA glycosylase
LATAVKQTLADALQAGGSSLRDYVMPMAAWAIFSSSISSTAAQENAAVGVRQTVRAIRQGQRATYFCPGCQKR